MKPLPIREPIRCIDCQIEGKRARIVAELVVYEQPGDPEFELHAFVARGHRRQWRDAVVGERIRCGNTHGGMPGYVTLDSITIGAARRRAGVAT